MAKPVRLGLGGAWWAEFIKAMAASASATASFFVYRTSRATSWPSGQEHQRRPPLDLQRPAQRPALPVHDLMVLERGVGSQGLGDEGRAGQLAALFCVHWSGISTDVMLVMSIHPFSLYMQYLQIQLFIDRPTELSIHTELKAMLAPRTAPAIA
jgi:hypothetical protein